LQHCAQFVDGEGVQLFETHHGDAVCQRRIVGAEQIDVDFARAEHQARHIGRTFARLRIVDHTLETPLTEVVQRRAGIL
jgi:hypothetical protein